MTLENSLDPTEATTPLDVLVIGAGQAGLAVGYHLQRSGLRFQVVDAAPRIPVRQAELRHLR
jgi:cation diffusion facilitator CzcD-associated flavoprotein CzcO